MSCSRMRFLVVLALVSMTVISSLAMTRKVMVAEMHDDEQNRQLDGDIDEDQNGNNKNSKDTNENHHAIPRKDFGKYIGQ